MYIYIYIFFFHFVCSDQNQNTFPVLHLFHEMATHSSILAQKIPWTEEPGRLQFMESQRVRHD